MKNNTILTNENATVLDMSNLFAFVLSDTLQSDNYNIIVDSLISFYDDNALVDDNNHTRDDYIHVYRHSTTYVSNKAHNNVFQCYLKHRKQCVCVVCNRTNFDAFNTDIKHDRQVKSSSLYRYVVSYDNFIAFMREIIAYDMHRQTTSATIENVVEIAK